MTEYRSAFRNTVLIGGAAVLATYLIFAAATASLLERVIPGAAAAAKAARGGILDSKRPLLSRVWITSATVAAGTLGTGLSLVALDTGRNYSSDWRHATEMAIGFFVSAVLWVPIALAAAQAKQLWIKLCAAVPVWSTAVFNLLLAISVDRAPFVSVLLVVAVAHHIIIDGIVWVYMFVFTDFGAEQIARGSSGPK